MNTIILSHQQISKLSLKRAALSAIAQCMGQDG